MTTPSRNLIGFGIVGLVLVAAIAAAVLLQNQPSTAELAGPTPDEAQTETPGLFVSALPADFADLELVDFPGTLRSGYAQSAVAYGDHVIVASLHYLLEYNRDGQLVRVSDPEQFDCPGGELPAVITIAGDTLYSACWNSGLFEIDLANNRVVDDLSGSLANNQNMYPVVDGDTLWVGTFNGLTKIDRETGTTKTYRQELGVDCEGYNVRAHVFEGDVWTTVTAHSNCGGGVAHYQRETDTWEFNGPSSFNSVALNRIDFNDFIVSAEGVFAMHQDGGPDKVVLNQFDPETNSWELVVETTDTESQAAFSGFIPSKDEYLTSYQTQENGVATWHVKGEDGWILLALPDRRYLAMSPVSDDRYFLLSTAGIEQYVEGEAFPELLALQSHSDYNGRILVSSEGRYMVGMTDVINEMGGEWVHTTITVYDRQDEHTFSAVIEGSTDPEVFPPAIGWGKDPTAYSLEEGDDFLTVIENGVSILSIDLKNGLVDLLD